MDVFAFKDAQTVELQYCEVNTLMCFGLQMLRL